MEIESKKMREMDGKFKTLIDKLFLARRLGIITDIQQIHKRLLDESKLDIRDLNYMNRLWKEVA